MRLIHFLTLGLALSLSLLATGCDDDDDTTTAPEAGEMMAGEDAAGEDAAGEDAAGETMAGETMAGETMAGETPADKNIVEVAVDAGSFTTLVTAVQEAGLVEFLSGEGPFTVLAPTDEAFDALPEGTVAALIEDAQNGGTQLADILKLHVVADAAVASGDLSDGQVVTTANGDLTVAIDGDTVTFSSGGSTATVAQADIPASNGVIHVIDTVLLPATESPNTIVDVAVATEGFSTLVTAVQEAGLADLLSSEGPFTVFAPTDDAFDALPEGTVAGLVEDAQNGGTQLADILKLHVVAGAAVASGDLTDGQVINTENGDLTVSITEGTVSIKIGEVSATVTSPDVPASNGVIHVIDAVLLPPSAPEIGTIVDVASETEGFTTLVTAVQAAGLVETLSSEGPFTVFAPTDDAFDALPEGTVAGLLEDAENGGTDLAEILKLHVVAGAAVTSDTLTDGQVIPTENGGELTVSIAGNGEVSFTSGGGTTATVIAADVPASNGVIHVINGVLLP